MAEQKKQNKQILTSTSEIMEFLDCGRKTFKEYIDLGLPVSRIGSRLIGHKENIEDFVKKLAVRDKG